MTAKVIEFKRREYDGPDYPHVACASCDGNKFHVTTHEVEDGRWMWKWIICVECGSSIPVDMTPVYKPGEGGG